MPFRRGLLLLGLLAGVAASGAPDSATADRPVTAGVRQAFSYDFALRRDLPGGDESTPIAFTMDRFVVSDVRFVQEATRVIDRAAAKAARERFRLREGGRLAWFHLAGHVVDLGVWRHIDLLPSYNAFRLDNLTVQIDLARIRF